MEPSVEANEAAAPAANGSGRARRQARGACRRTPLSTVAPAITGSATWRESRLASSRVKPRRRAAASVAPLRETPGTRAHAWATPRQSASAPLGVVRAPGLGRAVGGGHRDDPATSPAAIVGGVPRRPSIGRSSL